MSEPVPIETLLPPATIDLIGLPTHECVCGCNLFHALVTFHEREVGFYYTSVACVACGAHLTAPTLDPSEDPA